MYKGEEIWGKLKHHLLNTHCVSGTGLEMFIYLFNCSLYNRLENNTHDYCPILFEEIVDQRNSVICPVAHRGECDRAEHQTNRLTTEPIPIPRQRVPGILPKCLGKEMKQVKTLSKILLWVYKTWISSCFKQWKSLWSGQFLSVLSKRSLCRALGTEFLSYLISVNKRYENKRQIYFFNIKIRYRHFLLCRTYSFICVYSYRT